MLKTLTNKLKVTLYLSFLLTATLVTGSINSSYAAFPVEQNYTTAATSETINSNPGTETQQNTKVKALNKHAQKSAPAGKSQLVALILCFFLGALGIHRFYLGYTWQGVVQLLTFGGFGIWALIDFIRIIIGDLGPKDSSYDKTL